MTKTPTKAPRRRRKTSGVIDQDAVKALAHPLRFRILIALNQDAASPKQLAQDLGESLGNVSYHVRYLFDRGAVELIDTKQRRGAIEHFYRATQRPWFDADNWSSVPLSSRRSIIGATLAEISTRVSEAAGADGFDDTQANVTSAPLEIDEQGMTEVTAILDRALEEILDVQARAAARRSEGQEAEPRSTHLVLMHFLRAPRSASKRRR
jgi:DNA-binding transcriptional ArsR family regulator